MAHFQHATFAFPGFTIPSPVIVVEPSLAGTLIPSLSIFKFLYADLDSDHIQAFAALGSTTLTATWLNGASIQIPVHVSSTGDTVTSTTIINRRVLGIGPLGRVRLGYNTYLNDPIPVVTHTTPIYQVNAGQAFVVTCLVSANTLLVTPQFQAMSY